MNNARKYIFLASVVSLVLLSGFILWSVTRISVPDDIEAKLGHELIERIEAGSFFTIHDCIIVCTSTEDMNAVLDTLPGESVKNVWDSLGGFHAFLTPGQIFSIGRMNEVVRIDYNGIVTIA